MKRNLSIAAVIVLIAATMYGQAPRQESQAKSSVPGAWLIDVTPEGDGPPPFKILLTLAADGTVSESQNDMLVPPFFLSPGHGTWTSSGSDAAVIRLVQFASDPSGNYVGTLQSRATARVQGRRIEYTINVELVAPDGTVMFAGKGNGTGSRIQ